MEVLKLLEELEDIIDESSSIPFGNKVLLDKKEALEIIKEIRIQLPDEIKQAEWINTERQRILAQAQQESDAIVAEAKLYVQEKIEASEIIREAQKQADNMIAEAQAISREIRIGAGEYADEMLKAVQQDIEEMLDTISENREELRKMAR